MGCSAKAYYDSPKGQADLKREEERVKELRKRELRQLLEELKELEERDE